MSEFAIAAMTDASLQRLRIEANGAVQGVGFRPFVHRLAVSAGLAGFVRNTGNGVVLEVEGPAHVLERFVARLDSETAPPAAVRELSILRIAPQGERDFEIMASTQEGGHFAVVLPDLAICPACLAEMRDPGNRRYGYPFTTCVHCGPRFSIIEDIPYDRSRTTMRRFTMCPACRAEYNDPESRRFHAETNACALCGPRLTLWNAAGRARATEHDALRAAADALRSGAIVAIKGLGGFQILVDARNDAAVSRLRERKRRPSKPFAIMVPGIEDAEALAEIVQEERRRLTCAAAPIVLLRARAGQAVVAPAVAPTNAWLGIMLPYTPLHHLLMQELGFPIVATSGNRGGEPIIVDERDALDRLAGIADLFPVHDRVIAHAVDDSIVRVIADEPVVLRHARGYAPLTVELGGTTGDAAPILALGGHGKSAIALTSGRRLVLGPDIGDLDSDEGREAFAGAIDAMTGLYRVAPRTIACDAHPDYHSTQVAQRRSARVEHVPHHLAHVLAAMADNGLQAPLLGVAWDGSGYDGDGTVWGGEFLALEHGRLRRVAHLLPFRLLGGERAAREPDRAALGALYAAFGETALTMMECPPIAALTDRERTLFATMLARGIHSPFTSSAGRLFDAAAAIVGVCRRASFEGEAAIALESIAQRADRSHELAAPVLRDTRGTLVADWRPTLVALAHASHEGMAAPVLAAAFHDALAAIIVEVAWRIGMRRVLLSGGCFQNARLAGLAIARLRAAGFETWGHRRIPPNDGGLAAGQAVFAAQPMIEEKR